MTVLTDTAALREACAKARRSRYVTIDTEFVRETTYWANLCLVQVASEDELFAVDALAPEIDLGPLYDLLRDEAVLKVFHAARQDMEIFVHEMGDVPGPIFDTQVAAMVCGFGDSVGYETLVTRLADVRLDKAQRFTDWSKRPLSPRQIAYALDDVVHLRTVFEKLEASLNETGRLDWLDEEMAVLTDARTYRIEPDNAWKRLKPRSRNRHFLAMVRAIAAWREREAERRNVPRNRVIRDDLLLEMAAKPPHSAEELGDVRGLSRRLGDTGEGKDLIAAINQAERLPDESLPVVEAEDPRLQGGPTPLGELLRVLLKIKGHEHGVAPKLIAASSELDQIAVLDEPDVPALKGWRYELFGKDALALKEGRLGFAVKDNRLLLLHLDEQGAVAEALIRAAPHSSGPRPSRGRRGGGRRPRRQSPDASPAP